MHAGRICAATLYLLLATACNQTLTIPDSIPEPLVQSLPLRAGLHYTTAFTTYRHTEHEEGQSAWDIELGPANAGLFNRLTGRMFRDTAHISTLPTADNPADVDLIIEPVIEAFEFSLPSRSASDQYAVWIRYTLNVYGPQGELITVWKVSGYGEVGDAALQSARPMEQATVLAMRDAAATISLEFTGQPGIDELLREQSDASTDTDNQATR